MANTLRTDLALEAQESLDTLHSSIHGISVEEIYKKECDITITRVDITTKNGAKAIGKPMGTYITLEAPALDLSDDEYHHQVSNELSKQLYNIIPNFNSYASILIVGLGNRDVTADSLGPKVVDQLYITRHLALEYDHAFMKSKKNAKKHIVSSLAPGVMAQTGMETAEIIKGVIGQSKPDLMIVIDSLAARSIRRLNRTIQISNTGIWPGSGVGNHRHPLTKETLGIPVIAIGIPIVVDAATIVKEAAPNQSVLSELNNMYVTSKDIDTTVRRLSFTLSEALNHVMSSVYNT